MTKAELRSIMKKKRKQNIQKKEKDKKIFENFILLNLTENYDSFFVYNSYLSEADTSYIIDHLLKLGKKVYLPKVTGKTMLALPYKKGDMLARGKGSILEPCSKQDFAKIDVCITPLLAFTKKGERLGYGGGYYDKFFEENECLKVGYAYDFQLVKEIEVEPNDKNLDLIITDNQIYKISES